MQGAGRSIVEGTKKGYQSAKSGIQKWIDPASAEPAPVRDSSKADTVSDRKGTGGKTVVHGHQSDEGTTRTAQIDEKPAVSHRKGGGGRQVVYDHEPDDGATRIARADDGDPFAGDSSSTSSRGSGASTRLGARKVGTNVSDTLVIE
jgi:hypothetical protein